MKLRELEGKWVDAARLLMQLYHAQGMPRGSGAATGSRWFGLFLEEEGAEYMAAAAWIHHPGPFAPVFQRFNLPQDNAYFLRRVAKFTPGDHLVTLLNLLASQLRSEGKKLLVTLGLPGHSNALYKLAGFKELAYTPRKNYPVYVLYLD
ncbi:MAG: hypothetical protein ACP5IE_04300 [Infirmifilum sp.]